MKAATGRGAGWKIFKVDTQHSCLAVLFSSGVPVPYLPYRRYKEFQCVMG